MTTTPDTVTIDGVVYDVIVREPAKGTTSVNVEPAVIKTVDMLLLGNDRVVYQCAHPDAKPKYDFIADSIQSVTAHQRSHSSKLAAKRAQAELDRVKSEKAAQRQRRSTGVQQGNAIRKARHDAEVTAEHPQVRVVQRLLSDLGVGLDKATADIDAIRTSLRNVSKKLDDLIVVNDAPATDIDVDKLTTEEKFALVKKLMS